MIKIALAHHRFGWVHPFGNGNGRTVRLLTYALLIKYSFNVQVGGRVLNPTAVFCNDRGRYYAIIAEADTGMGQGLENWCLYVLAGTSVQLKKVDQVTNHNILSTKILYPALDFSQGRGLIHEMETQVLKRTISMVAMRAGTLKGALPGMKPDQPTYQIGKLVDRGLLELVDPGARTYKAKFSKSYLIRGVNNSLKEEGFITEL